MGTRNCYYEDPINVHGEWQLLSASEYGSVGKIGATELGRKDLLDGDDDIAAMEISIVTTPNFKGMQISR